MPTHGETSDDYDLVGSGHVFKEKVVSESDDLAVLRVAVPCLSFVVKCVSTNCCLAGSSGFLGVYTKRNLQATLGFKFMQPPLPGRRNSLFLALSRTWLHRISQPIPLTKVETKYSQTHPGIIIAKRTEAGSNQLTIGPNPNCLNFISGVSQYLAHILCTFLFLSLGTESPQGGILWQRILCF